MDKTGQGWQKDETNGIALEFVKADFSTYDFKKEKFNGFMMANSLHFIKDKAALVSRLIKALSPNGRIVIIEYDTDSANNWVPFPISYECLVTTFPDLSIKKIGERPSRFGRTMYCCEMIP